MSNIDWPGLLKWSLQYTDETQATSRSARSPEDIAFLEGAIREALRSVVDPNDMVREALPKLHAGLESNEDDKILAPLSIISEAVDIHPEVSRNMIQLKAIDDLLACIDEKRSAIVIEKALDVWTFVLPNNPPIQAEFFNHDGVTKVFAVLENRREATFDENATPDESRLYAKAFGCLAHAVRNIQSHEEFFIEKGGVALTLDVLQNTRDPRLAQKALSMLHHLLLENLVPKDEKKKEEVAKTLIHLLKAFLKSCVWGLTFLLSETTEYAVKQFLPLWRVETEKWDAAKSQRRELSQLVADRLTWIDQLPESDAEAASTEKNNWLTVRKELH